MARINVCAGCMINVDFVLKNRILADDERVVFRTILATDSGSLPIEHIMQHSEIKNMQDSIVHLSCDLADSDIIPGIYTWDLLLQDEDGCLHCLLPSAGNVLCVYNAADEFNTEGSV